MKTKTNKENDLIKNDNDTRKEEDVKQELFLGGKTNQQQTHLQ